VGKPWTTEDIPPQTGKRIIVTGANSGIGWHTALELTRAGAEVAITARSEVKADDAAARICRRAPDARLKTALLDLATVRAFAAGELADPRPIDTLPGSWRCQNARTADGFERQFATNVLGPFLLTGLLLPAILRAAAPRIVTVSSETHTMGGPVPVEDLNSERDYRPLRAYAKTKLENILFTCELQRRAGNRLLAVACHPGVVDTNLPAHSVLGMKLLFWGRASVAITVYPLLIPFYYLLLLSDGQYASCIGGFAQISIFLLFCGSFAFSLNTVCDLA
jgi:NAD(P)-dependent dehydrogenase (short-subunit alcohol dehydrogenase family)